MFAESLVILSVLVSSAGSGESKAQLQLILDWDGIAPTPVPIEEILRSCDEVLHSKGLDSAVRKTILLRKSDAEYFMEKEALSAKTANEVLKIDANNHEALWRFGRAQRQSDKLGTTIETAKKLIKLRPDSPYGYFLAGCYHNESRRYSEAVPYFDQCIEKDKAFGRAYLMRATSLLQLKKFDASMKDIDKAFSFPPTQYDDRAGCHFIRGAALQELGRYSEASSELLQVKKMRLSQKAAANTIDHMLWNCYSYAGKHGSALKISEAIAKNDLDNSHSHVARSRSLAQFGVLEESEKEARLAVKLSPKNAEAWTALGIVLELRGDYRNALRAHFQSSELAVSFDAIVRFTFLLATCPDKECRNGKAARTIAEAQFPSFTSMKQRRMAKIVMSMVLAECGEYEKAAEAVSAAAKLGGTDADTVKRCDSLKELYTQAKPYRHDATRPKDHVFSLDPGTVIYIPISEQLKLSASMKK